MALAKHDLLIWLFNARSHSFRGKFILRGSVPNWFSFFPSFFPLPIQSVITADFKDCRGPLTIPSQPSKTFLPRTKVGHTTKLHFARSYAFVIALPYYPFDLNKFKQLRQTGTRTSL
jgi:hypothetical protein